VRRAAIPWIAALFLPVLLVVGIWLGGHPTYLPDPVRDLLVDDEDAQLYEEAMDILEDDYYKDVDRSKVVNSSLDAAIKSLGDRFSAYFNPKDYQQFQAATTGEFEGVGMTVDQDKRGLKILTVFDGSPADRGGLKAGDLITDVDDRSIAGMSSKEATTLIKGQAGTKVRLRVVSGGRARDVVLERARVSVPAVRSETERLGKRKIGHVRLAGFTSGSHGEVRTAVRQVLKKGADGIVLDLRDNGGGLLNEAVLTSSIFLSDGEIVSTKGRARPRRVFRASGGAIDTKVPVVVLVNGESASASEIVTGALQDRHRAKVVGEKTFGKGVFQEIKQLSNGGALDITVGEYFTPSGRNLGGKGIKPDVPATDDPKTPRDEALDVAVRTVARVDK
jgi:carboxyl-terminal processing protease